MLSQLIVILNRMIKMINEISVEDVYFYMVIKKGCGINTIKFQKVRRNNKYNFKKKK